MLILADSFGVQRTSEELLEFLEVNNPESHNYHSCRPVKVLTREFLTQSVRCMVTSSIEGVRSAPTLYSVCMLQHCRVLP